MAVLVLGVLTSLAWAQDKVQESDSIDAIQSAIAEDTSIDEQRRSALAARLQSVAQDREKLQQFEQEQRQIEDALQSSDQLIADYKSRTRDIQSAPATLKKRLGDSPSLSSIETEASLLESQRSAWAQERGEALDSMANLAKTNAAARSRVTEVSKQLAEVVAPVSAGESPAGIDERVSQFATQAHQSVLQAELNLLELRLRSASALNTIRSARIAWLDAAIAEADELLSQLRQAATTKRQSAAAQRATDARRMLSQLSGARPELKAVAQENLNLVSTFETVSREIEEARQSVAGSRRIIEEIQQDADLTERRLNVAGLESKLGEVMLTRLASLPDPRLVLARNQKRNEQIALVSMSAIDNEQALRELGDRDGFLTAALGDMETWNTSEQRSAERLYDQRRELLQENMQAGNTLLSLLVDANQATAELAGIVRNYENLLTANLLWVRNYTYFEPYRALDQLRTLGSVRPITRLQQNWAQPLSDPIFLLLLVLTLGLLQRSRIVTALDDLLGKPIRPSDESASLIFKTLLLSVLASLSLPGLFFLAGRGFYVAALGDPVMMGIGEALGAAGLTFLGLGFLNRMADRLGVGRRLLKWNNTRADVATRDLLWFTPSLASFLALIILGRASSPTDSGGALAAIGSMATAIAIFIVILRLLRSEQFSSERVVRYCLQIGTLIAAAIIVMHLSGQLFAAHLYLRALIGSVIAVLGTLVVTNILQRLLILFRSGLERRAREEQKAREQDNEEEPEDIVEITEVDTVASLSEAYLRLLGLIRLLTLGVLLWLIWAPALPALSIFDAVTLWTTTDATLPDGELRAITLSTLLMALLVIGITTLVTRHLPPLVNVVLTEWTRVTPGSRYAAGMLMQYLIIGVGFSTALAMLGFQWGKVQWLVAALGVGIGFGLQEIVANFISGLIVLFERPIRVGDIINAGGADGTVTQINARATVIVTFDGKELMIPNKELITGVVTNWSLSNSKLRLVIPIGIAYGSDVDAAMEILRRVALSHPEIIDDPAPIVTFEDFGDNALVLWLRCYALKDYPRVSTELRQQIYREFNDAGISISFPQRDVHLDASGPLPVRIIPSEPSLS